MDNKENTEKADIKVDKETKENEKSDKKAAKDKKPAETIHKNHRERMYNRFLKTGLKGFSEHEVLEFMLFNTITRKDTNEIAHRLLKHFTSLTNVLNADIRDLVTIKDMGLHSAEMIVFYKELQRYLTHIECKNNDLYTASQIGYFCVANFGHETIECINVISLNAARAVTAVDTISKGTEFGVHCCIKDIVRFAFMNKSKYIILCHNHPFGSLNPSSSNISMTHKISTVMNTLEIPMIDHIICNSKDYISFAERNLFFDENNLNMH